ncbi:hypothetical protein [Candidatus Viridilinea mediisalina]|uniref:Winged helix domain-containing protein n=1 Tax=Candidatus Viridilinea mediisalina TaxID=2024553 RepID=A0A2A6RHS3_9CHLR|nr:hypothetical protein [Candidatus Viridilinea mediisalina]PDW02491.1 hypothetical protein CJ255_13680 [Candidatus Viridilinea mediisalina]
MDAPLADEWSALNQGYLAGELERLHALLQHRVAVVNDAPLPELPAVVAAPEHDPPPALVALSRAFGLSSFERDLLLLCAAVELDARFPHLCAAAQDNPECTYPTLRLALAALPEADWHALTPTGVLRRWGLIELNEGHLLTTRPLRASEQVLHYLMGQRALDEQLLPFVDPLAPPEQLVGSQQQQAVALALAWEQAEGWPLPLVQLCGEAVEDKRMVAAFAAACVGLRLFVLRSEALPINWRELVEYWSLWCRDAALLRAALLIEVDDTLPLEREQVRSLHYLLEQRGPPLLLAVRERRVVQRHSLSFEIGRPLPAEQRKLWHDLLAPYAAHLNGAVEQVANQFNLSEGAIQAAVQEFGQRSHPVAPNDLR